MKMLIAVAVVGLAACSPGSDEASLVSVTNSATTCDVVPSTVEAGNVVFSVQNTGSTSSEFSVLGPDGNPTGQLEDLGPGEARDLVVSFEAGSYTAVCGAGEDAIRQSFTVTAS